MIVSDALQKAQERYENKRQVKRVSFNIETEKELLEFANSVDFSSWVKQKISEAIADAKATIEQKENQNG